MLKKVKNINFLLKENNNEFDLYKKDILNYWNQYCKNNPNVFNGYVISASNIEQYDDDYNITINIIKYCDSIYSRMIGKIKTRIIFSGGYIITKDNYICFAINENDVVNLIGGVASLEDISNSNYNPDLCLIREFKEEIGLNLMDKNFVFNIKYLKCPKENECDCKYYSTGLIYEIKSNYNKKELIDLFNNSNHDDEIISLLFLKSNEFFKLKKHNKKDYMDELCELIEKELL